jgi:hypothetical protein
VGVKAATEAQARADPAAAEEAREETADSVVAAEEEVAAGAAVPGAAEAAETEGGRAFRRQASQVTSLLVWPR